MQPNPSVKGAATGLPGAQPKPTKIPEIAWLAVTDLQVDHSYQHDSYEWAIEEILVGFRPEFSGLILVNIRTDGRKFILDGATRWQVRLRRGDRWILAEIVRGLTPEQEADVYLIKADNKVRAPIDWFVAEVRAGRPQSKLINDLLNARGIHVKSYATRRGMVVPKPRAVVTCVEALKRMVPPDSDGSSMHATLDLVLATWNYKPRSLGGEFLLCLHDILAKHGGRIVRKRFIAKFQDCEIGWLWDEARKVRDASTPRCTLRKALETKILALYDLGAKGKVGL